MNGSDELPTLSEKNRALEEANEKLFAENQRLEHECWGLRNVITTLRSETNRNRLDIAHIREKYDKLKKKHQADTSLSFGWPTKH
jgi:phage shock protein A